MQRRNLLATAIAAPALHLATGCSTVSASRDTEETPARITVLYDAFGRDGAMQRDWGYAALVEMKGKRVLFDTGNNPDVLAHNAAARHVDLTRLDFVVMSHRHGDHMGGMAHLLGANPEVPIFAPKETFGIYGSDLPSAFYRKDDTLPPEQRYYGGQPPAVMRFGAAWPKAHITLVDSTREIAPGFHLISLVSDKPGTLELRELSLAIVTAQGMVLLVGCSHAGIDRILAASSAIHPQVRFLAGGFHFVTAKDPDIEALVATLRDTYKVGFVAPGHCTGEPAFAALRCARLTPTTTSMRAWAPAFPSTARCPSSRPRLLRAEATSRGMRNCGLQRPAGISGCSPNSLLGRRRRTKRTLPSGAERSSAVVDFVLRTFRS